MQSTLDDWIRQESISFTMESDDSFSAAIDKLLAALVSSRGADLELLGWGEALHGSSDMLLARNRLFTHLVGKHGFSAIAVESSFSRGHLVNEFVSGSPTGDATAGNAAEFEDVQDAGFSHNFGRLPLNRTLVEWMRDYNGDLAATSDSKRFLRFYGFDSPTEMMYADSPRQVLQVPLDFLSKIDPGKADDFRKRIEPLLGDDAPWQDPAAAYEPSKSIGLSPAATALRIETENLITELGMRRPELIAKCDLDSYREATHHAALARQLLSYHAAFATNSDDRYVRLLGIRDWIMADNLSYIVERERGRGKVLAFAHNMHLQRGLAEWKWGPQHLAWWPAGAHLSHLLGPRYAAIGLAVGNSEAQGIAAPAAGTLEERLLSQADSSCLIATRRGRELPADEIAAFNKRSGSAKNSSYFPLTAQSLNDFDGLVVLKSIDE